MYTTTIFADYRPPVEGFNPIRTMAITEITRVICYNQTIYDDNCMEEDEFFNLTLTIQEGSAVETVVDLQLSSAVVRIVNDDCKLHPCTARFYVYT